MTKVKAYAYLTACVLWALLVCSPAFALWAVSLFSIRVDMRFDNLNHLGDLPGWTKSELTYYAPKRRPI